MHGPHTRQRWARWAGIRSQRRATSSLGMEALPSLPNHQIRRRETPLDLPVWPNRSLPAPDSVHCRPIPGRYRPFPVVPVRFPDVSPRRLPRSLPWGAAGCPPPSVPGPAAGRRRRQALPPSSSASCVHQAISTSKHNAACTHAPVSTAIQLLSSLSPDRTHEKTPDLSPSSPARTHEKTPDLSAFVTSLH